MRILIVHNMRAGNRSDDIFTFIRSLAEFGMDEIVCRPIHHGMHLADALHDAQSFDLIVSSGGDGTASKITYALANSDIPVMIYPSGTANLLANNLGTDREAVSLARLISHPHTQRFDMGEMMWVDQQGEQHRSGFSLIAGAGYDATIMRAAEKLKPTLGMGAYYAGILANPFPKTSRFTITHDGEVTTVNAIAVLLVNFGELPMELSLSPSNQADDGMFDIVIVKASTPVTLLPTLVSAFIDKGGEILQRPKIEVLRAREVTIDCDPALPIQFDGELVAGATTPFKARIIPGASNLVVSEGSTYLKMQAKRKKGRKKRESHRSNQ